MKIDCFEIREILLPKNSEAPHRNRAKTLNPVPKTEKIARIARPLDAPQLLKTDV